MGWARKDLFDVADQRFDRWRQAIAIGEIRTVVDDGHVELEFDRQPGELGADVPRPRDDQLRFGFDPHRVLDPSRVGAHAKRHARIATGCQISQDPANGLRLVFLNERGDRDVHPPTADQPVVPTVVVIELEAEQFGRAPFEQGERPLAYLGFHASPTERAHRAHSLIEQQHGPG
jgi:hypothetical protein